MCIFFLFQINSAFSVERTSATALSSKNWEFHPRVVEIRRLYNQIQVKLRNKELKFQQKDFSRLERSCRGTYPLEYIAVATDSDGHVKKYVVAQRISHDDLLTTEKYYDDEGYLRFVYSSNKSDGFATIENRVYLDTQGKVFWDVKSEANRFTYGEMTHDPEPWAVSDTTNEEILERFNLTEVKCKK
jgi:hypothetical protein